MPSSPDETPDDSTPQPDDERPAQASSQEGGRPGPGAPGGPQDDALSVDAEFLRLVEELDDVPGFRTFQPRPTPGRATGPRDWPTSEAVEALEEAESHFSPPDPGLDLSGDPLRIIGWLLVVIGVVGILAGVILMTVLPHFVAPVGGGAVLLGAVILLWRMPRDRPDHDLHGSDGAVV
jgi:uncharacterized protein (TIGR04206 family)